MTLPNTPSKAPILSFVRDQDSISAYYREIRSFPGLTVGEEARLALEIRKGNKQALHSLVQANLKFVVAVCHNYAGRGLPFGDLVNEGNLGLIRAAYRFDGMRNCKFISYAVWWIRQGILTALAEQTRTLSISTNQVESLRAVNAATRKLEQVLERSPSTEEVAAATGKSPESILRCRVISAPMVALSQTPDKETGGRFTEEMVDATTEAPDRSALSHLLGKKVKGLLDGLREQERTVLRLYYGIGGEYEYNLAEIGELLSLSRERIRQIKYQALQNLRLAGNLPSRRPRVRASPVQGEVYGAYADPDRELELVRA